MSEYGLIGEQGVRTLKMLREQTFATLPEVPYLRLVSQSVDRYHDSSPSDREYRTYPVRMNVDASPEEIGIGAYSMDFTRGLGCVAPIATFERLGFEPKMGDAIEYDGARYEVVTVIRQYESRIGNTNEFLCYVFVVELQRGR